MSVKKDAARGTWYFVIDVPAANGRRQQVRRRGFKTKRMATDAQAAMLSDTSRGLYTRPATVTVESYLLDEWLPAARIGLRPSTINSYERMIELYVQPSLGRTRLTSLDGSMLNALYHHLLTEGRTETRRRRGSGLSPKTVRNVHGLLDKALHDAVRWGRLGRNPCYAADPPRGASPEMQAWTAPEIRQFIESVTEDRWSAIWILMATTGMRRGEALGLRWTDIDLEAASISIRVTRIRYGTTIEASTPKTARGTRTIAIGPKVVSQLRAWRKKQTEERLAMGTGWLDVGGLVVTRADGSPPNPESFSNAFKKLARDASLRPIRLHDLRHSYATAALAASVPVKVVSQRLGHADVVMTLKVYAHVMPGDDQAAAEVADRLLTGG